MKPPANSSRTRLAQVDERQYNRASTIHRAMAKSPERHILKAFKANLVFGCLYFLVTAPVRYISLDAAADVPLGRTTLRILLMVMLVVIAFIHCAFHVTMRRLGAKIELPKRGPGPVKRKDGLIDASDFDGDWFCLCLFYPGTGWYTSTATGPDSKDHAGFFSNAVATCLPFLFPTST